MIAFNKVTFVDDNDSVPVDAANLNALENAVKTLCDGGAGSNVDADYVRGKDIATPTKLTKGLITYWDLSAAEYPDKASSTLYFRREWPSTDLWTSTDTSAIVGYSSNHLTLTPNNNSELVFERTISGLATKTVKIKIKNTGNFNPASGVLYLSGGSGYQVLALVPYYDYYIGTVTCDATTGGQLKLKLILDTAASSAVQYIQWVYAGTADYLSDSLDLTSNYPAVISGATPTRDGETYNCLFHDGVNDRTILSIPSLYKATSFSLVLRATSQSTAAIRTLCVLGQGSNLGGVTFSSGSGSNNFNIEWHRSGATETLASVFTLSASTVATLVLTFDLATKAWTFYKDGALVTGGTLQYTPVMPAGTWELGSRNATEYFKGYIGTPMLYDKVLTSQEVWELQQRPYFSNDFSASQPIIKPTVPLTATSPGRPGQLVYDTSYVYVCIAPDTWKRFAITTW